MFSGVQLRFSRAAIYRHISFYVFVFIVSLFSFIRCYRAIVLSGYKIKLSE